MSYHVFNRGVNRDDVFFEPSDYRAFLLRLHHFLKGEADPSIGAVRPSGGTEILAYCLMPNHYHLLLTPDHDGLSRQMQRLSISYTRYLNLKYGRVGPLFQGQFRALAVRNDDQLLTLTAYIHVNPSRAGLESSPGAWPYSSYPEYIGIRAGTLPSPAPVWSLAGGPDRYRQFMTTYNPAFDQALAHVKLED